MNDHDPPGADPGLPTAGTGPGPTGAGLRPVVLRREWRRGERISRALRPDGTAFTVTVPRSGGGESTQHLAPEIPWISDDSGRSELSDLGAATLAAVVGRSLVASLPATP